MVLRWPDGLDGKRRIDETIHFCDWLPTLASAADVEVPDNLEIDGVDMLSVLHGKGPQGESARFWQWNRYEPLATSNAAVRDGDWKLVRPVIAETVVTSPEEQKLDSAFRKAPWRDFEPIRGPFPPRNVPAPGNPQLFHIVDDPQEGQDLAPEHPDRVERMLQDLETWFESVENDRASIGDIWEGLNED
jgi:arylsulfatase A